MATALIASEQSAYFEWLCRMGDSCLILGHRLSEWCGHGPMLEEDIAIANTALDLIGQAQLWLALAAEVQGTGHDADHLAYHRDAGQFRNLLLVERPNGDFGTTIMRQFLFDTWHLEMLRGLQHSQDARVAAIADKSAKEVAYHLERSADLIIRLGDGTPQSHDHLQNALIMLWPYTGELFAPDAADLAMAKANIAPDPARLQAGWHATITQVMEQATLVLPESKFQHLGGKSGKHTEALGYILAELQFLQRAYPNAVW